MFHEFSFLSLQGLPSCPISLETIRSHLPDISSWTLANIFKDTSEPSEATINSYNKNIQTVCSRIENSCELTENSIHINGTVHNITAAPGVVPIYKIPPKNLATTAAKTNSGKKMPAFRGRRGWCGCLKVSFLPKLLSGYMFSPYHSK